jgi:hypothetical protein
MARVALAYIRERRGKRGLVLALVGLLEKRRRNLCR